jgi:DNA-binding LacI/PurR family transcriptional regulator
MNIREIAKLAKCSPSTVSRVLSKKKCDIKISANTRDKILKICAEYDYHPSIHAMRFFSQKSKTVALLTPETPGLDDYCISKVMNAACNELNKNGYRMLPLIKNSSFIESKEYLDIFKRNEIDALLIWGIEGVDKSWVDELHSRNLPFILISNRYKDYPSVTCDDQSGIKKLTQHCLKKGSKNIVYLSSLKVDCCERRKHGFIEAVETSDCKYKIIESSGLVIEDGIKAAINIIRQHPDTVICANDKVAIGVMLGIKESGLKVPEDIMITGADNIEMAEYLSTPLTTFDNRSSECGRKSVSILMEHINNGNPLKSSIIPPKIHIRNSA